jgi:hypothetical protein
MMFFDNLRIARTNRLALVTTGAILLAAGTDAAAQTGPGLLLKPFRDKTNVELNGSAIYLFDGQSDNDSDTQLGVYQSSGRAKVTLEQIIPGIDRAIPRVGYDLTYIHLNTDDTRLPENLTDASVGFGMGIFANDKWLAGITVGLGYASVSPFSDGNGWYGKADLAVGYTIDDRQSVGVVLSYDGNRTFLPDVPLPGFAYRNKLNDQIDIGIGFPFSDIRYKPDDKWTFSLTYSIPDDFSGSIEYALTEKLGVYASLERISRAFRWDELANPIDRVIFHQSRVELGLRARVNEGLSFTFAGGFAFAQEFETGFDTRDAEQLVDLSDEPYVRAQVQWEF